MKQIKYVLSDFSCNKRATILYVIQMTIVLFLMTSSIDSLWNTALGLRTVSNIRNQSAYVLTDTTDYETFSTIFADSDTYLPLAQELYSCALNADVTNYYTEYSYIYDMMNGIAIEQYTASKSFFEIFNISVMSGRSFIDSDFSLSSQDTIPILVGFELRNHYRLGQIYELSDCGTGEIITCQVVGILKNNTKYYDLSDVSQPISMNYAYIKPLMTDNVQSMSFSDIDMALHSTVFLAPSDEAVKEIAMKSNDLGLFKKGVATAQARIEHGVNIILQSIGYELSIATVILLFASIGMSANLSMRISKQMGEYSIHILCGGRYTDIATRLLLQSVFSTMFASIPVLLFKGLSLSLIFTTILSVFFAVIIAIAPIYKLYSVQISEMLRRTRG